MDGGCLTIFSSVPTPFLWGDGEAGPGAIQYRLKFLFLYYVTVKSRVESEKGLCAYILHMHIALFILMHIAPFISQPRF